MDTTLRSNWKPVLDQITGALEQMMRQAELNEALRDLRPDQLTADLKLEFRGTPVHIIVGPIVTKFAYRDDPPTPEPAVEPPAPTPEPGQ
jgi:hypothetical protein